MVPVNETKSFDPTNANDPAATERGWGVGGALALPIGIVQGVWSVWPV
jgi:hypothetical protein